MAAPMDVTTKLGPMEDNYQATDEDCNWYASVIGLLMYAILGMWADLAFSVFFLSHYLAKPGAAYITAVKWIMHYLWGFLNLKLVFKGPLKPLLRYTDSN